MSWNDEDEVRELRATLRQLRASLRDLAEEMRDYPDDQTYADRVEALAGKDEEESDDEG